MGTQKKIHYIHFDTIDSTNTWAKQHASSLDPEVLTCITTQEQTAGRGRFSRKWISPKGKNICATLYFTVPQDYPHVANLAQLLSLSCVQVLKSRGFDPLIKWPNDILLEKKKVGGVLCETTIQNGYLGIALGIGLNVNVSQEVLETIDQPATSLAQLSGHTFELEQILEPLLKQFLKDLSLLDEKGFEAFIAEYESLLAFKGEEIRCYDGAQFVRGICHSLQPGGRLNLLLQNGAFKTLSAGELIGQE